MAKFILMFDDTIDGGIEASYDIVNLPEGVENTTATTLGRQLMEEITEAWSFKNKGEATNAGKKSKKLKKAVKATIQAEVS